MPSFSASRTIRKPGSETQGVPASVTSATFFAGGGHFEYLRCFFPLVEGVITHEPGPGDIMSCQQVMGAAGVLGGYDVRIFQDIQRPDSYVVHISDGSGHQKEGAGGRIFVHHIYSKLLT